MTTSHRRLGSLSVVPLLLLALLACKKGSSTEGASAADAAPAPSTTAASEDLRAEPGAVCSMSERKVWGKWPNPRTGITVQKAESSFALGLAIGNRPHVLVVDSQGNGQLVKVALAGNSELAKDIPAKEGSRDLQRVTPARGADGGWTAYADYRDKYQSKRRRIACELVANNKLLLGFDDVPLLERKKDEPKVAAESPDGGAPAKHRLDPKVAAAIGRRLKIAKPPTVAGTPPAAPGSAQPAPSAEAEKPAAPKEKKKPLREIRDCRTFVDAGGGVWAVGSELYGEPQDDDSVKWSMRFFVAPDAGGGYFTLASNPLPKEPKELYAYEAPTAAAAADGSIVLAARYRGALTTWLLSAAHRPTGRSKTYRGGWPTMAELVPEEQALLLLTSQKVQNDRYELRFGRIGSSGLPATLDLVSLEGADSSVSEPTLAMVGGQRWLGYHAGKRREGQLVVLPVDASLKSVGKSQEVAANVVESVLLPLADGKLLSVYFESAGGTSELVSRVLSCAVKT